MTPFFVRLRDYYLKVAEVLRGEASAASVFPNATDIGIGRERVYAEFLRQHAPSKCNVFFGGFLFDFDGNESGQLDVLVTTDTTPRFDFHNADGGGKSFSPVEGTLAVASVKSTLDKAELEDALAGIAKIPRTGSLEGRIISLVSLKNYDDWPYKVIYASDGISAAAIMTHLLEFYKGNPGIPFSRRPNVIHVAGKYAILRVVNGLEIREKPTGNVTEQPPLGGFMLIQQSPDLVAMTWVLDALQQNSMASTHILFSYSEILNRVNGLP